MVNWRVFGLSLVLFCGAADATLADAKKVAQVGDWTVLRETNPMTDAANCTAIYKGEYRYQLTKEDFFVAIPRGGVKGVTLRFGDQPARELRLATSLERSLRAVRLTGSEFEDLKTSGRLRWQVLTILDTMDSGEVNTSDLPRAVQLVTDCSASSK